MTEVSRISALLVVSGVLAMGHWWVVGGKGQGVVPKKGGAVVVEKVVCDPARLSPEEICLEALAAGGSEILWLDARSEADWKRDGLPGSKHLTLGGNPSFDQQVEVLAAELAMAPMVVVYCSDVGCGTSKEVVKQLRGLGGLVQQAYALHGGYEALKQAGRIKGSSGEP